MISGVHIRQSLLRWTSSIPIPDREKLGWWKLYLPARGVFRYSLGRPRGLSESVVYERGTPWDGWKEEKDPEVVAEIIAAHAYRGWGRHNAEITLKTG